MYFKNVIYNKYVADDTKKIGNHVS